MFLLFFEAGEFSCLLAFFSLSKPVCKRYCDLRFGLRNIQNINPVLLLDGGKKRENEVSVSILKDTTGIYFLLCSCVCPLIFSFLQQSSGNLKLKQFMPCRTWWLNLIWLSWRWTDNGCCRKTFCRIWKDDCHKERSHSPVLQDKVKLDQLRSFAGSSPFSNIWYVLTEQKLSVLSEVPLSTGACCKYHSVVMYV